MREILRSSTYFTTKAKYKTKMTMDEGEKRIIEEKRTRDERREEKRTGDERREEKRTRDERREEKRTRDERREEKRVDRKG